MKKDDDDDDEDKLFDGKNSKSVGVRTIRDSNDP